MDKESLDMMQTKLFGEKLGHYATCAPKHFLKLDGFYMPEGGDCFVDPDEDGDEIIATGTVELMDSATVRVLIPADSDPKVAARQLKKIAKWLKRKPELMERARPPVLDIDDIPF